MKVLAAIFAAVFALFPFCRETAEADTVSDGRQYARADTRNVYFCSAMDDDSALFALPYTYCVEIISEQGEWYLVRYAKDDGFYQSVTGYCKKDGLTVTDDLPQNIYLNYPVTATLKSLPQDGSLPGLEIEVTAAYYGVYYKGAAAYSYVLYNGSFRYIAGANEDYPLNEIPVEPAFDEQEPAEEFNGKAKLITALTVTIIAAAAIVVLILSGKRKGKK